MTIFQPRISRQKMATTIAERFNIDARHISDCTAESSSDSNQATVIIELRYRIPIEEMSNIFNQCLEP